MSTQLRFIRPWNRFRKGDTFSPAGVMRQWLVKEGFCEIVVEEPEVDIVKEMAAAEVEVATVRAPEVAALRIHKLQPEPVKPKRKPGRPRKKKANKKD